MCISYLLTECEDKWLSSIANLRIASIAHYGKFNSRLLKLITISSIYSTENPKDNPKPPIANNKDLLIKLKTFLVPTSDPALRLEASIICGILLNVPPPEPLRTRETYTFIINNLFETISCLFKWKRVWTPLLLLPLLSSELHSCDVKTVSHAASAMSYLLEHLSPETIIADATTTLLQLMLHPAKEVVLLALQGVGNIIICDESQIQIQRMINLQVIPTLLWLVDYPDKEVQIKSLWTLSNITAGPTEQMQAVIDAGVIPKVIPLLDYWNRETKEDRSLFIETSWLIGNICTYGSINQKRFMLNEGMIERFFVLLKNYQIIIEQMIVRLVVFVLERLLPVVLDCSDRYKDSIRIFVKENHIVEFIESLKRIPRDFPSSILNISTALHFILVSDAPEVTVARIEV